MMATSSIQAWHFLAEDRRLRFGDRDLVEAGRTYTAEGPLILCHNGMHASERVLDALSYAPGPIVCRVELSGEVLRGDDKLCARSRRVLWMADATLTLHEYACREAEMTLERERESGREPDVRCWEAIQMKRRWMAGEASLAELSAAWSAAESVARSAAESVARSAAEFAAKSAAEFAAKSAAEFAAESAAGSAVWSAASAAWSAAGSAAESATWSAVWSAVESVARSAARSAASDRLETMLLALGSGAAV